uniref:Uncharacterized protein n=1 Tax=Chromera velia CCMP2878 TaxID=1169474 RepID=A0A0K6S8P5_9ALVE|eukprot:Cvel_24819.t1-p1 / transcript=Cvel_24819.t1 / gene=Cvel_24819 / organism=Chromera_velia_CCMP2878 / gene_product=hypothetical protein / transcript_product=hypothetical protein / location=Cvel_scaffold2735:18753-22825(-) / protein_length=983 / sequence_SO=supercontig / SO=protein_coding / is_pseudo=false
MQTPQVLPEGRPGGKTAEGPSKGGASRPTTHWVRIGTAGAGATRGARPGTSNVSPQLAKWAYTNCDFRSAHGPSAPLPCHVCPPPPPTDLARPVPPTRGAAMSRSNVSRGTTYLWECPQGGEMPGGASRATRCGGTPGRLTGLRTVSPKRGHTAGTATGPQGSPLMPCTWEEMLRELRGTTGALCDSAGALLREAEGGKARATTSLPKGRRARKERGLKTSAGERPGKAKTREETNRDLSSRQNEAGGRSPSGFSVQKGPLPPTRAAEHSGDEGRPPAKPEGGLTSEGEQSDPPAFSFPFPVSRPQKEVEKEKGFGDKGEELMPFQKGRPFGMVSIWSRDPEVLKWRARKKKRQEEAERRAREEEEQKRAAFAFLRRSSTSSREGVEDDEEAGEGGRKSRRKKKKREEGAQRSSSVSSLSSGGSSLSSGRSGGSGGGKGKGQKGKESEQKKSAPAISQSLKNWDVLQSGAVGTLSLGLNERNEQGGQENQRGIGETEGPAQSASCRVTFDLEGGRGEHGVCEEESKKELQNRLDAASQFLYSQDGEPLQVSEVFGHSSVFIEGLIRTLGWQVPRSTLESLKLMTGSLLDTFSEPSRSLASVRRALQTSIPTGDVLSLAGVDVGVPSVRSALKWAGWDGRILGFLGRVSGGGQKAGAASGPVVQEGEGGEKKDEAQEFVEAVAKDAAKTKQQWSLFSAIVNLRKLLRENAALQRTRRGPLFVAGGGWQMVRTYSDESEPSHDRDWVALRDHFQHFDVRKTWRRALPRVLAGPPGATNIEKVRVDDEDITDVIGGTDEEALQNIISWVTFRSLSSAPTGRASSAFHAEQEREKRARGRGDLSPCSSDEEEMEDPDEATRRFFEAAMGVRDFFAGELQSERAKVLAKAQAQAEASGEAEAKNKKKMLRKLLSAASLYKRDSSEKKRQFQSENTKIAALRCAVFYAMEIQCELVSAVSGGSQGGPERSGNERVVNLICVQLQFSGAS